MVDCLNCEMGCNGGPGTINRGKHPDVVEGLIENVLRNINNLCVQKHFLRVLKQLEKSSIKF